MTQTPEDANKIKGLTAYERVKRARDIKRPGALDYIEHMFDGFIELHGDRLSADDHAIIGGIAMLYDMPVTVVAQQRGVSAQERKWRNYAMPHPEGYRKALRLIEQAEKFSRPIICIVDTPGAYCGVEAEKGGQAGAIAGCLFKLSGVGAPVVTLVIGEGGSGGAMALSVCDRMFMMENAVFSVISPEGCASILFKDPQMREKAAESLKLTAPDMLSLGLADEIIPEPEGFGRGSMESICAEIKRKIYSNLKYLKKFSGKKLAQKRQARYLSIGRKTEEV